MWILLIVIDAIEEGSSTEKGHFGFEWITKALLQEAYYHLKNEIPSFLSIVLHEKKVGLEDDVADMFPESYNINASLRHLQLSNLFRLSRVVCDVGQLLRGYQQKLTDFFELSEKMLVLF